MTEYIDQLSLDFKEKMSALMKSANVLIVDLPGEIYDLDHNVREPSTDPMLLKTTAENVAELIKYIEIHFVPVNQSPIPIRINSSIYMSLVSTLLTIEYRLNQLLAGVPVQDVVSEKTRIEIQEHEIQLKKR